MCRRSLYAGRPTTSAKNSRNDLTLEGSISLLYHWLESTGCQVEIAQDQWVQLDLDSARHWDAGPNTETAITTLLNWLAQRCPPDVAKIRSNPNYNYLMKPTSRTQAASAIAAFCALWETND